MERKNRYRLFNRIIRRIFQYDYKVSGLHASEIYSKYKIPTVEHIIGINQCMLVYRIHNKKIKLDHAINRMDNDRAYTTRNGQSIRLDGYRTRIGRNNVIRASSRTFNMHKFWNNETLSLNKLKVTVKNTICNTH